MSEFIDVGEKNPGGCCVEAPSSPSELYPRVHITTQVPLELPDSGTTEIKFQVVERAERRERGKCSCYLVLEVRGIKADTGVAKMEGPSDGGAPAALDALLAKITGAKSETDDEEED